MLVVDGLGGGWLLADGLGFIVVVVVVVEVLVLVHVV